MSLEPYNKCNQNNIFAGAYTWHLYDVCMGYVVSKRGDNIKYVWMRQCKNVSTKQDTNVKQENVIPWNWALSSHINKIQYYSCVN